MAALIANAAAACGGGDGSEENRPPLGEPDARAAIVTELLTQPEARSGIVRFAVHDAGTAVEGVADFDHQRYVSRLDVDRSDVVASYDVAVIEGLRYEKILKIENASGSPAFKGQWSSGESWAPDKEAFPSVPYVPLPFVGEPGSDIRRDLEGFDSSRTRQVLEAVIAGFSNRGPETRRGEPTVKYTLSFDRGKVEALLGDELARGLVLLAPGSPAIIQVDVWIDHQGRLRAYKPTGGNFTREYELWDYGKPSALEVPGELRVRK
ncbi:MAG: hypothetical protein LC799_07285 [Actinobacteria bacterium]|nr:hypothetical protein [Actinomycetota bacterium]